jgi:hypothetical protein
MATGPEDWNWWWGVWKDRIRCGLCRALMELAQPCPVCGQDYRTVSTAPIMVQGRKVIQATFAGALDWSPYLMLQLMHREWLRPPLDVTNLPQGSRPSPRVLIVLIFWTFFETLMDWFYRTATGTLPEGVQKDLLKRHSSISARIGGLHRVLFATTYDQDLDTLGFTQVKLHLETVRSQRNAFMHGNPEAITELLVDATVNMMAEFQKAWIESFNKRCAKRP